MVQIDLKGTIVSNDEAWIYEFLEMEHTTPNRIREQLEAAAGDDVEIIINSPGGYVDYASEIYEMIRQYEGNITTYIVGQAASCASFIACAGYCKMSPTASIYLHNCWTVTEGDYKAMKQAANNLKATNEGIIAAYKEKTGMTETQLATIMENNTLINAQQALEYGFCDEITTNTNYTAKTAAFTTSGMLDISKIPRDKLVALKEAIKKPDYDGSLINTLKKEGKNMSETLEVKAVIEPEQAAKAIEDISLEAETIDKTADAVSAERERIKAIDAIASMVPEDMLSKAKFDEPISAQELAYKAMVEMAKHQDTYMDAAKADVEASGAKDVTPSPVEAKTDGASDRDEFVAKMKKKMENRR